MRFKKFCCIMAAILAAFAVGAFFVACDGNVTVGPGGITVDPGDKEETVYTVSIIDTKTQTVKVKPGETLVNYIPAHTPKRSGKKFVGWFADGEDTEYDWTKPVNKDLTIRSRFEDISGITITSGIVYPTETGAATTGSGSAMYLVEDTFESGSFTVDVVPGSKNDCGVVFGVELPEDGALWEENNYFTLLINKDGNLLLASIKPTFTVIAESNELSASYDVGLTYRVKIRYDAGYCEVYVNNKFMMASDIGELPGNRVGCRAQNSGVAFGKMTFDADDKPTPSVSEYGEYKVFSGGVEEVNGAYKTTLGNTLVLNTANTFESGSFSVDVTPTTANDCGVVFGAPPLVSGMLWENGAYFTLLINKDGNLLLAKVYPGFTVLAETRLAGYGAANTYNIKIRYDDGYCEVLIDGTLMLSAEIGELPGPRVGCRAQSSGTVFGAISFDADDKPEPAENDFDDYKVYSGGLEVDGTAYKTTQGSTVALDKANTFESGSFSVDMTQNVANDCGVMFGVDPARASGWEKQSYYTVLINKDGFLLFARVAPWKEVCSGVKLNGFSTATTYTIKVSYDGGRCEVFVNGTLLMSENIGALEYTGVGVRAQSAGVTFGKMSFDADDKPVLPETSVGGYTVRNGALTAGEGYVTSSMNNTLAILDGKEMGETISFTMTTQGSGDNGIVFALTDNTNGSYWENHGESYYFFFIDIGGKARFAKLAPSWTEPFGNSGVAVPATNNVYEMSVSIDSDGVITCSVNGMVCFVSNDESGQLTGVSYGIRAGVSGVKFVENVADDNTDTETEGGTVETVALVDNKNEY